MAANVIGDKQKDILQVNNRKPFHSINFVIAHDGFTLYDLVSYNNKHNEANGEGGNDGCNDNYSWNCGHEGETADPGNNALRSRQMKNFHLALMISQGCPMILMGDEYAHTRFGNNNSYGHDSALNNFQWNQLDDKKSNHFRFFSETIKFRREHPVLRRERFLGKSDITWHEDNWDNPESKFLAFTVHDKIHWKDIYLGFNAHHFFCQSFNTITTTTKTMASCDPNSMLLEVKFNNKHGFGPGGGMSLPDGVDASGRRAKGKGVYQFANKYGANVDGYSPIYSPEEWSPSGDVYVGGKTGLLIWAVTLGALLLGGALLVYNTSALSQ